MRSLTFIRSIGSGAFGTVYLAELSSRQGFRRQVAVKVLHKQNSADGEQLLSRIRDEARLLGLLQDDIIIKVLEIARIANRDAVLMEYVEGVDLQSVLADGHRPSARALADIGAQVAGGLSRAHRATHPNTGMPLNVIHRDVKPANIMVTRSGSVKLLDFGVARARFDARESHTGQLVLGTLNYMAPEYIVTGEVSPAADVYGLAVSMWQVATGEPYGQPKVRQDSHERRMNSRLEMLSPELAPLEPAFRAMLQWDHTKRPDAQRIEAALDRSASQLSGDSLRVWSRRTVTDILQARGDGADDLGIVGRTIELGTDGAVGPPPLAPSYTAPADPSVVESRAFRSAAPDLQRPAPTPPAPKRQHVSAPLSRSTPPPAPHAPQPDPAPGFDPSLIKDVVGGLLAGGSVGLLFVACFVWWILAR